MSSKAPLYKICRNEDWLFAQKEKIFPGTQIDRSDGYIHLCTKGQLAETLVRHFSDEKCLILLEIQPRLLGQEYLKWEPARGGEPFPHLYAPLPLEAVTLVFPIPDVRREQFARKLR